VGAEHSVRAACPGLGSLIGAGYADIATPGMWALTALLTSAETCDTL
jgi:hypothetical protein